MARYKKKFVFVITVTLKENPTTPSGPAHWTDAGAATKKLVRSHILDAVKSWGGQAPPDYPLWPDNIQVTVKQPWAL